MEQQCKNCGQEENCRQVFEKLGDSKTPPVLLKVIQAFLLPLILFIAALAAAERLLADKIANSLGRNLLSLAAAAAVISLYLAVLKFWRSKN